MTSELKTLRSLADRVRPPKFEALEEVARRRTRRTAATAAASCVLAVLVVAGGIVVATARDDRSAPEPVITPSPTPSVTPSPTPTPDATPTHQSDTSMTPREVVLADNATLQQTAVSADDPDFRFSVWMAECTWCPKTSDESRFPHPWFGAMAITTDSFQTVLYRHAPWFDCRFTQPCGSPGVSVESVGPGLLLVVDDSNGYEWLVRDDGTITALARDFDEITPSDPRLWFTCLGSTGRTGPGGQALPFDAQLTSCALDPDADTVHIWQGAWAGTLDDSPSVVHPGAGVMAWGIQDGTYGPGRPLPDGLPLVAWWETDGSRHYQDLGVPTARGVVDNAPRGVMSVWSWVKGSPTLTVFTSTDEGDTWQTTELAVRFRPSETVAFSWTPDGALVARQNTIHPDGSANELDGLRIWRADFVDGGGFAEVYEASTGNQIAQFDLPFTFLGDRIWASRLWSDDDGRTWTEVTTWRP